MRYEFADSGFFPGQVTRRSEEILGAFNLHHQELVDALAAQNPDIPFVLVLFGSVAAGVALVGSDLDVFVFWDDVQSGAQEFNVDPKAISKVEKNMGLGEEFFIGPMRRSVSDVRTYAKIQMEQATFTGQIVGSFLIGPFYGNEADIEQMEKRRSELLASPEGTRRPAFIQQSFEEAIVRYDLGLGASGRDAERGLHLAQALDELGITKEEWLGRRRVEFPKTP